MDVKIALVYKVSTHRINLETFHSFYPDFCGPTDIPSIIPPTTTTSITSPTTPIEICDFNATARKYVNTKILGIDSLEFYHLIMFCYKL